MATEKVTPEQLTQLHLTDNEYPRWSGAFTEDVRCEQVEDDLFAARSVTGVLIAIVSAGAIFGAITVAAITLL